MVKYVLSILRPVDYLHPAAGLLTVSLPRVHLLIPLPMVRLHVNAHLATVLSPDATRSTVTTMKKTTLVKLVKGIDVSTFGWTTASTVDTTKHAETTEVKSGSRKV